MKWLKWQENILNNYDDLDVLEVMAIRCSGKTTLSLAWVCKDADLSIFINPIGDDYKARIESMGLKYNELHIIRDLEQLRGIDTNEARKIRIAVDEYFYQPNVTLKKLDEFIGHERYKVLFIGTRRTKEDKFKIPFSKQFYVGLADLIASEAISLDSLLTIANHWDEEQLQLDFGAPFEVN